MTIRLHPFGQAELDQRSSDWVTSVLAGAEPSVVSSERADVVGRVAKGGYPVVQELNPRLRADWLRDYVNRLVERKVSSRLRHVSSCGLYEGLL